MLCHPLLRAALLVVGTSASALQTRTSSDSVASPSPAVIAYTIRIDAADLTGFGVEMALRNVPDTFLLAMPAHQEYDEEYWRHVEGLRVDGRTGAARVTRVDSALWRVIAPGGDATVHYRIRIPASDIANRSAWKPFLSPTGGLIGGPYGILYVVGATTAPAHVRFDVPRDWNVATALQPTSDPRTYYAANADALADAPVLMGHLRSWRFFVGGVPHRVVYWPLPNATPFDTVAFAGAVEKLVRQAVALFGRAPWAEYSFLFQDGSQGALEHRNSVALGAPSASLAQDPTSVLSEVAHEFVHAWNLMRLRPAEYRAIDYRPQGPTSGLWWSEGMSMFYSDLLLRRSGLPVFDSTRVLHLERLVASYLGNPAYARFSAERVSQVAYNASPGALGDYSASTHLQGELLGAMLDFLVRDATNGARSIDDVMRFMVERYADRRGFVGKDLEGAVASVCGCNATPFFDSYVRGATKIDIDRYLGFLGLRARVTWNQAMARDGTPVADLRMWASQNFPDSVLRIVVSDPASVWGQAGLHTGDELLSMNGNSMRQWRDARGVLGQARVGDTVRVTVKRAGVTRSVTVKVAGLQRPTVRIEEIPAATTRQRELRMKWTAGSP
jgi:predicted metalloprotease with PDZ domain